MKLSSLPGRLVFVAGLAFFGCGGVSTAPDGGGGTGGAGGRGGTSGSAGSGGASGSAGAGGTGGVAGTTGAAGTGGVAGTTGSAGTGGTGAQLTVTINEISTANPDYIELFNTTAGDIDISNWYVTDSDPTHTYTFPTGSIMASGAFIALEGEMMDFDFGLSGSDAVVLHNAAGTVIDTYTWDAAPSMGSYSRCPNGTGAFTNRPRTQTDPNLTNNCP